MSVMDNALQALFKMAHKEILWENASPGSKFAAQKIPITLKEGSIISVEFRANPNSADYYVGTFIVDGTTQVYTQYYNKASDGYSQDVTRKSTVETTGITFGNGILINANVMQGSESGFYYIPIKVLGIKP